MPAEGRGLGSGLTQHVVKERRLGNLATPASVQKLQTALHAKAKTEAEFRFYALYDKIYREDILAHAYAQCRSNKGAPGVDGQDFPDIEAYGLERWLGELAIALKDETYRPEPIRRVFIPKPNGGYNGDPVHAVVKLLSTWKGCLIMMACLLFIMHVGLFLYLVIRFARGLSLPVLTQLYCITIVLLVIAERIRLLIVDGNAFFWFGAFSLPHALCLFAIIWMNANSSKPHVVQRVEALG
jgi:hypothetical protein